MVEDAKFWVVEPRISLERRLRAQHAALGQLHRLPGRQVERERSAISSGSTSRRSITGPARPAIHAEVANTLGSLGHRRADLLPPAARRPSRGLQPCRRRQVGRDHDVRRRAVRQVRHVRDAFLECERHRRLGRRGRRGRPHRVARCGARRRHRVRCARLRSPRRARAARTPRSRSISIADHRDEAARSRRAALRALFQRVGARPVGRRAGDAVRLAGRARSPTSG